MDLFVTKVYIEAMLLRINIRNIVLIEQCEIDFSQGLCVLTGETGAGKSILLDSLGLILGMRGDSRLIRHGKEQAEVSAVFEIKDNQNVQNLLSELAIEAEDEIIIRRIINQDGKGKAFINDVGVSINALKAIGDNLIEIHGQHDGRGLMDSSTHRQILDLHGELQEICGDVEQNYKIWQKAESDLQEMQKAIEQAERDKDYLLHVSKELSILAPQLGEEDQLADKRNFMMQNEKFVETLNDAMAELNAGKGVAAMLGSANRTLARSALSTHFAEAIEALERASNEVSEAEAAIEKILRSSQYDKNTLDQIEERLFALRAASRKYNMPCDELANFISNINDKLEQIKNSEHATADLQKLVIASKNKYLSVAKELSAKRIETAKQLQKAVLSELQLLKMQATEFEIAIEQMPEERWNAGGIDNVSFQAATNKGMQLAPLNKIASGGELSRFMLAMKVALAKVKSTPTLIFDEIDTGTGGAVADSIGKRLAELGTTHQILVVTHLPQVAACGNHHLFIQKQESDGKTFTNVKTLSQAERVEELARMLAGAEITPEARLAAEKLLLVG